MKIFHSPPPPSCASDSLPEKAEFRSRIPMGRYGKSSGIAAVIGFLASEGAGHIRGQNLRVDGGTTRPA